MHLVRYRRNQALLMRVPPSAPDAAAPDTQTVRCIIAGALGEGREWLNEAEARQVMAAYGIPILPDEVAADPAGARAAPARLRAPLALNIPVPDSTPTHDSHTLEV